MSRAVERVLPSITDGLHCGNTAVFQVSKQAAAIRLETLKISRPPAVADRIPGL